MGADRNEHTRDTTVTGGDRDRNEAEREEAVSHRTRPRVETTKRRPEDRDGVATSFHDPRPEDVLGKRVEKGEQE